MMPAAATDAVPQDTINYIKTLKRPLIDVVIARSGRVDIIDIPWMPFRGTSWVIEKPKSDVALVVTNRHIARSPHPRGRADLKSANATISNS